MAKTKQTPEMELASENAALRAEIGNVEAQIPNFTAYAGPRPESTAEFSALPKPWRDQLIREHPGLLQDLMNRAIIAEQMADMKKHDAKTAEILADLPFKSNEELAALPEKQRAEWAGKLSREQMDALAGTVIHTIKDTL